ncbi:MAG: hypothetical protein O2973_01315 [Gemmatimonadetes bacterium]|nr:hypothetical protein [Gemmatimonadota bacterium]
MIVVALRRLYHALVPLALRRRMRFARFGANNRARAALWRQSGGRIAAGPFKGLLLAGDTPGDCYGALLLGSYECETHDWLEHQFSRGWSAVVNIGSDIGYYSTGTALRLPRANVYAFEMIEAKRAETARSAVRNGVASRVHALGFADPAALAALPVRDVLVISDCEGYEAVALDPTAVPWLANAAMLIELHDFAVLGATETLRTRFSSTHDVVIVKQQPRDPATWARRAGISLACATELVQELRLWGGQHIDGQWMFLTPKTQPAGS